MQKNLSEKSVNAGRAIKYVLLAFIIASVGTIVYRLMPCCGSGQNPSATAVETDHAQVLHSETTPASVDKKSPDKEERVADAVTGPSIAKRAVVYYFYTSVRCYSCKMVEDYTREAVAKYFARPYKGWMVEFQGVNVEEMSNRHFIQDYLLNSKSVVVQKYDGEKALDWIVLKNAWQFLMDKDRFMNYIADETRKLLDR